MRLYLVRHGESDANVAGIINDDPRRPVHLTSQGRQQAKAVALALQGIAFRQVYVSRFPRTRQTAEIVLAALGLDLPIREDGRLDERRSGLDGQPVEVFNGLVRPDPVHLRPGLGETFLEQMTRVRGFLDDAAARHPADAVLAVSHENPINAVAAVASLDPEVAARRVLGNCEWIVVDWAGAE